MQSSLVFAISVCIAAGTSAPSCKSDTGADVDFAYSFKYPKGWEYAYMDSDQELAKAPNTLDSSSSSISSTIMQMHDSGVSYLLWNDEPAGHSSSSAPYAHSKGLLLFTSAGGVWLTHSLPHFPLETGSDAASLWSLGADDFGQAFLCITVDADAIHTIAPMFNITRPTIYATQWTDEAKSSFPDLMDLDKRGGWDDETMTTAVSIKSKGGQTFNAYGKAGKWGVGKDLYRDLVAPAIGKIEMEGWRRGAGVWDAACGKDEVLDVLSVSFPEEEWPTMSDHSKWAVTETGSTFCVGDLNRANGQDKRGGATVCIESANFAGQMRNVISTTDKCASTLMMV